MESIRTTRRLVIALIFSGALNVFTLSLLFYVAIKERPPTPYFESKPSNLEHQTPLTIDHSNHEVIRYFRKMPLDGLIGRLTNQQPVENGYTQRDLALASLVAFHDFDLERALSGFPLTDQRRQIEYGKFRNGKPAELTVFPGLSEAQFEAITAFAKREQWPLTAKGLFQNLKKNRSDSVLVDTMLMTPEFIAVYMLFERGDVTIDKQDVLTLILEGNWDQLARFVSDQKVSQDLSSARRQRLLLEYLAKDSKTAARLLIKSDPAFARLKIDDTQVIFLLSLLENTQPESVAFAQAILISPRTDDVRKKASEFLNVSIPAEKSRSVLPLAKKPEAPIKLTRAPTKSIALTPAPPLTVAPKPVIPENRPPGKLIASSGPAKALPVSTNPSKNDQLYVVQEGDSLWKISRKFNVDMNTLKTHNRLETEFLSPGRTLKIPSKTS